MSVERDYLVRIDGDTVAMSADEFAAHVAPLNERARKRLAALPPCSVCHEPMTCGQQRHHHECEAAS